MGIILVILFLAVVAFFGVTLCLFAGRMSREEEAEELRRLGITSSTHEADDSPASSPPPDQPPQSQPAGTVDENEHAPAA